MRGALQQYFPVAAPEAFDGVIELLLGACLLFAPLAFGTAEPWSEEIVIALAAAMACCLALKGLLSPAFRFVWSWIYLPVGLFASLILMQLLPFSSGVVQMLSGGTTRLRRQLLSDMPNSSQTLSHQTISLYPPETFRQLGLMLAIATVLVVVVNVYRDRARIQRLLLWISIVGLFIALFAVYQNVSGTHDIYAGVQAVQPDSGPFMCHSHFGQFMNLSFGAALGLLITRTYQIRRECGDTQEFIQELREFRSWDIWLLCAACIICPTAMALSLTRGGIISLLAAVICTAVMLVWRSKFSGQISLIVVFGILAFSLLSYLGFEAVYSRLATLRHLENVDEGRWQMLKDMTAEFKQFPIFGTGLGTHEYVFPMFDHSAIPRIATYAEDEYAQILEECGGIGLAMVAVFLLMVGISYVRIVWRPQTSIEYSAFGLGCGLLAILFQSATDFGQHLPANALLTAIFSALMINLASRRAVPASEDGVALRPRSQSARRFQFPIRIASALTLVCAGAPLLLRADRARCAEAQWNQAYGYQQALEEAEWQTTDQGYLDLLTPATAAAELEPKNIKYRYWLDVYRWHSISQTVDPKTNEIVLNPMQETFASRIVDDLESCRALCPSFGPALCVAGQIELFVFHQDRGKEHIELASKLTPYDQTVCYITGDLEVSQGQWDASLSSFRRCVALGQSPAAIIQIYFGANRPDLAYEIARGNRDALSELANLLSDDKEQAPLVTRCRSEVLAMLEADEQSDRAAPDEIAELASAKASQGDTSDAIRLYSQALDANYAQVDWRLRLASLLMGSGQKSEALRQARICLHLQPQSSEAQALANNLFLAAGSEGADATDANSVGAAGSIH